MVVLTTSKTTTTGVLAVLAYTTVSMGDVAATGKNIMLAQILLVFQGGLFRGGDSAASIGRRLRSQSWQWSAQRVEE